MPISSKTSSPAALTGSEATRLWSKSTASIQERALVVSARLHFQTTSLISTSYKSSFQQKQQQNLLSAKVAVSSLPCSAPFPDCFSLKCHPVITDGCDVTQRVSLSVSSPRLEGWELELVRVCVCVSGSRCGYLASTVCEGKQIWTPNPDSERQHLARI